jgi:type VI secretion system protein ImpC
MSELTPARPLERARRPRVQISYEVNVSGTTERVELPFVIGVLADLSGRPATPLPPFRERRFIEISRDTFDAVFAVYRPGLDLSVPDELTFRRDGLDVTLHFRSLTDFGPAAVAAQVEPLRAMLEARGAAADPTAIDRRLSAQLRPILHHPDFRRLEAAWRGLHYLVTQTETGPLLRIRVLSCTREELLDDLRRAATFDQSVLFEKLYEEPYRTRCGTPFGLLVGDYEFGHGDEDLALLQHLSRVAAAAHAPFVAAASPRMFGMERFTELANPRDLSRIFEGGEYARWHSFRDSEDSRYVALTVPRVLAWSPYGGAPDRDDAFAFEEDVRGAKPEHLWMSAAWAYAVRVAIAFARHGWFAATRGVENGGRVEGLPTHAAPTDDGAVALKCPTEIAIGDLHEYDLSNLGFLPLIHVKNTDFAVFMGADSCHRPRVYDTPDETARAELSSKLNLLLCASRFLQYLKILARDQFEVLEGVRDCEASLNRWLSEYVISNPGAAGPEARAKKPWPEARIELREAVGRPGRFEVVAYLRPYLLVECLVPTMRLVAEVPRDTAFRPAPIDRAWLRWNGGTVAGLARAIREGRRFGDLPILADALEDAGCADERILGHCREASAGHERGCWVLDALLAEA